MNILTILGCGSSLSCLGSESGCLDRADCSVLIAYQVGGFSVLIAYRVGGCSVLIAYQVSGFSVLIAYRVGGCSVLIAYQVGGCSVLIAYRVGYCLVLKVFKTTIKIKLLFRLLFSITSSLGNYSVLKVC